MAYFSEFLKTREFSLDRAVLSYTEKAEAAPSPTENPLMSQHPTARRDSGHQQMLLLPFFLLHALIPSSLKRCGVEQ